MQFGPRKQDALINPTNEKSCSTENFTAGSLIGSCHMHLHSAHWSLQIFSDFFAEKTTSKPHMVQRADQCCACKMVWDLHSV